MILQTRGKFARVLNLYVFLIGFYLANIAAADKFIKKAKFDHFYLEIYARKVKFKALNQANLQKSQAPSYFALQAVQRAYLPLLSHPLLFAF